MPTIHLDVTQGPHQGTCFELGLAQEGAAWSLGRAEEAAIALVEDGYVSRRQAVLRVEDGELMLLAWPGTTNPTRLNDRPLSPGAVVPLADQDRIQVGRSVLLCRLVALEAPGKQPGRPGGGRTG